MLKRRVILLLFSAAAMLIAIEYAVGKLKLAPEVNFKAGNIRFVENTGMVYELDPDPSDFKLEKPVNTVRIVVLGDAIARGVFVSPGETFCNKLEYLLNKAAEESRSPLRFEVMNFGVPGYNLEAEVEVLKQKALALEPDIVILNMFYNDNEPMSGIDLFFIGNYLDLTGEEQAYIAEKYMYNKSSPMRRFERGVLYRSKLYKFIVYRLANLTRSTRLSKIRDLCGLNFNDMQPIYRGFGEIDGLRKKHGFKFLVCIHPTLLFSENPNDMRFGTLAELFGFDYFYMFPYYKKEGISPKSLQISDRPEDFCHPNAFGHALIAKAMLEELKKSGFVKTKELHDAASGAIND